MSLRRSWNVSVLVNVAIVMLGPCDGPVEQTIGVHQPSPPPRDEVIYVRQNAEPVDPDAKAPASLMGLGSEAVQREGAE